MGVRSKRLSKGDIAALGGRAFATGMEILNRVQDPTSAIYGALEDIKQSKQHIIERGQEVPVWELSYFQSLEGRVETAITKYVKVNPLDLYTIADVELVLPDHGNARIDLGVRDQFGLAVLDYKFKLRLEAKYLASTIEEYRHSWQQYHYCWAYSEYKGEPVERYIICLVVSDPRFSVTLHEFPITPENMIKWKESAQRIWTQMEHEDMGLSKPWMVANHSTRYGPCPYKKACFDYDWDMPRMLAQDYVLEKEDD